METLRSLICRLDAWISKKEHVLVFSDDPTCLLRIQLIPCPHPLALPDVFVADGKPVLLLHIWNERVALIPPAGADLAWALDFSKHLLHSFHLVAHHLLKDPSCQDVQAIGGITAHFLLDKTDGGRQFVERMGFLVIPYIRPSGTAHEFWQNFYTWWLMWTYNPVSTRNRSMFHLQRSEFWMSRNAFITKFGGMNSQ
jgi:hypothetical protein